MTDQGATPMTRSKALTELRDKVAWFWPMDTVHACLFIDVVSGESVDRYRQINGVEVMASSRWSLFRIVIAQEAAQAAEGVE